jgi:hypothetical protein
MYPFFYLDECSINYHSPQAFSQATLESCLWSLGIYHPFVWKLPVLGKVVQLFNIYVQYFLNPYRKIDFWCLISVLLLACALL